MPHLALTIGDPTGIGPEITAKALQRLNEFSDLKLTIIGSIAALEKAATDLAITLPRAEHVKYHAIDAGLPGSVAYQAIETAVGLIAKGDADALVTGPISKRNLIAADYQLHGHTEILEELAEKFFGKSSNIPLPLREGLGEGYKKEEALYTPHLTSPARGEEHQQSQRHFHAEMLFVYKNFRLLLLTRHIALKDVPAALAKQGAVARPLKALIRFLRDNAKVSDPHIAMLAVNPHSGEVGGDEEEKFFQPVIKAVNAIGASTIAGPFPADGFFRGFTVEGNPYHAIVAAYHDQGLIPFKLLAGYEAVNVTIGLPFIRTSVSHGTAEDIVGKGTANEASLMAALHAAVDLL